MRGPHEHAGAVAISANAALMLTAAVTLFLLPDVAVMPAAMLLFLALGLIAIFLGIVFDQGIRLRRARVAFAGFLVLSCLLLSFAGLYHDQSTLERAAFSRPLGRLEAVYYAIGVVSTAGTNGVSARSRGARAELALQELTDVTMLALLVGGVLSRLAPRPMRANAARKSSGREAMGPPVEFSSRARRRQRRGRSGRRARRRHSNR